MKRKALFFFLPSKFARLLAPLLAAWPLASRAATVDWEGAALPTPGDGLNWYDPLNWQLDTTPASTDDVTFGDPATAGSTVHLNTNRTVNSLGADENFTIGALGTNLLLNNTTGNVTIGSGDFVTLNAAYGGANGLNLSGGGSLYLTNTLSPFTGAINVDGAGTTLVHRQEGPTVQYNGVGSSQEFGRFDQVTLGYSTAVRNINLTNGGTYRILNTGNNAEGNFKNIIIGAGGGTLDLAPGFLVQNLDDIGQITVTTNDFTKAGKGRLTISGTMANGTGTAPVFTGGNPLGGVVNINGGMLDLSTQANTTVGANTYVRFSGIAPTGSTLNVNNGGTFMANNGTVAALDVPAINLNDGSIFNLNGADHAVGYATATAAGPTVMTVSGTSTWLIRDLFGPQTQRFTRMRAELDGTGTLELRGNTNAGGTPRLVIERSTAGSDFSGTFRLVENTSLELNPRFNHAANGGTGTTVDTGKMLADGDVEFAGWGSTLDLRDSNPAAASVLDYTTNEISITTTQKGAVNAISPIRAAAATGTGHLFNFGTLTMGDHRLVIAGNNSYSSGFADTASIRGNAVLVMNSDNSQAVFSNAAAISEDAAGRSLTLLKAGGGASAQRDVIVGGAVSLSNLEVATGNLQLRGANGAIGLGAAATVPTITINGGMSNGQGNGNPTPGVLHLDSNTGHVVGATTVFAAANNNDRIVDSATINMRGNSVLRLTSLNNTGTTETIGRTNVSGHATLDVNNTGVTPSPVALTINTLNLAGTKPTVNFTANAQLGQAGTDTSRIVINPTLTPTGFMGSQFHSGGEWAKYDNTIDNGFELGVAPFAPGDYTIDATATDAGWAPGQQLKITSVALPGVTMTANRNVDRLNAQFATVANQAIDLAGFALTLDQGGLLVASGTGGGTIGITDGATAAVPSGTAGITSSTGEIYAHTQSQFDLRTPVTGAIDFVKSGNGNMRLIHQDLAVGAGTAAINPFTAATWSSTLTGNWIINDGRLDVHRGQFLGGRPVILNGGHLEINEPVSNANADSIIPGWGNDITVNGNASIGADDNGESADGNTGDRAMVRLGSLTINNGSIFAHGGFSDMDIAYMGGATFNGTPTLNAIRGGVNSSTIINGVLAGSGFNSVALAGNNASIVLGGGVADAVPNTYSGTITMYAGTLRPNKANGTLAITSGGAGTEDVILNGGSLLWGPGQHGDLATTNNVNTLNNGLASGIAPTSPAAIHLAGMNQIADTASITLLNGTLGEGDRITNEKFGTLIMKNGTFNVGLGTIEVDTATFSGGALGFDRGGTLKVGDLTYLPGSFDQNVFTGRPVPGAYTTLEIGAGGATINGQNMTVGGGFYNGNVAGAGGRVILGGDITFNGSDLIGGSYGRKGIFVQTGNSFREIGDSHLDLAGGTRDFNIGDDSLYTITLPIRNGGLTKSGGGALQFENYTRSTYTGAVTVNEGVLSIRADGGLGTSAGGVTINSGGTLKLETGWTYGDDFTVTGRGAALAGSGGNVFEYGAVVADGGTSRLTGAFTLAGDATIAGSNILDPSVAPGAGGAAWHVGRLNIEGPAGVTGTGSLTLSGNGDGVILGGVNSVGGLNKDGAGRWTIGRAGTYTGTTSIAAGSLRITDSAALGSIAAGTTVLGGSLEVAGGITSPEPLRLNGAGSSIQSGAVVNVSGNNALSGGIVLGSASTLRSDSGTLTVASGGVLTGNNSALTLSGAGNGSMADNLSLGTVAGIALIKEGTGSWVITGNGGFTGGTSINGGSLDIGSAGALLDSTSPLTMGGGSLRITGATQTSGGLSLAAGGGTVNGGAGLTAGAISRSAGATANFAGSVSTLTGNTNGILGSYATYGGNWAVGGGTIAGYTGYTALNNATGTVAAGQHGNYGYDANGYSNAVHTVAIGGETLRVASGIQGLALGGNTMTLGMGGLLKDGSSVFNIGGSGLISGATADDELILHVNGGGLYTNNPLIGAGTGSLTKAGGGELRLFGTSNFTGSININGGDLIVPGGVGNPGVLGTAPGGGQNRLININGGSFGILSDWDINDFDGAAGVQSHQLNIGPAGGTLKALYGANFNINDGSTTTAGADQQLRGSGDLTFSGGGTYNLNGGTPQFLTFTGNTTVDGGVLILGHSNSLGGRQEQTITVNPGSAIINNTGFGLGQNGIPNNIVATGGGVEFFSTGGNRVYGGDIQLGGTNTIYLAQRDTPNQERQLYFNGKVSGTGVTLDVMGANNGNPFYLASGANDLTGNINLNANAVLEVRQPGSLGINAGDVNVNLSGANSRLLLRHWQNGDYLANVNVGATAEINVDRLANYGGGANQLLGINNLTTTSNGILTFASGNTYTTRIGGTAAFNANTPVNATGNVLFENGITFGGGANTLDKRGGGSVILQGASNHAGATIVQQGFLILQGANGTLSNTSAINLRGGELRVDNTTAVNGNRLPDTAPISLGGGALRITGNETLGTVTAASGTTIVVNNPINETVPNPLTLTGFTRQTGSVIQFQVPDSGATGAVGMTTFGQTRVGSRIFIPGQADTTQTIPGFVGNNSLDFIQYNGTTLDSGFALGVQDMRNPGNLQSPQNYSDNTTVASWNDSIILRRTNGTDATTVTDTLTASTALDAIKVETGGTNRDYTIALGANNLRIEGGGIMVVGNTTADFTVTGTTGVLTAGPAIPGAGTAELFLGGNGTAANGTINISAIIGDNGSQPVALVKTGGATNQVNLSGANTYTGGTYVNSGVLNTTNAAAFGGAANAINLAGGTLQFNIANAATIGDLGVPDHPVNVLANSTIILDNGALAGTDNDITLGALTINGPYTLGLRSFDSTDATFTGTHIFAGTPMLDMIQFSGGGNSTGFFTLNGAITGSGFQVGSSGNVDNTTSVLQIGGGAGDTAPNTYTGNLSLLLGTGSTGSQTDNMVVQLNKAAGTTAVTGDIEINGGILRNMASNQIADTSNMMLNWGSYDANGQSETIASVTQTGGNLRTGAGTVSVTGDYSISGLDDVSGGGGDGIQVNSSGTVNIGGTLRMTGLGRAVLGASAATLNLNDLEMTGTRITQNSGGGANILRLSGDVTTFASAHPAELGNSTDSDTFFELNGVRQFTVADGTAGIDLAFGTVARDSTSPAATGGIYKTGPGTMQIQGGGTGNSYTGDTTVSQGTMVLFKSAGVNAIPANLFISDGNGPASVVVRNSNQIADTADVSIGAAGVLDLQSFNTSEAVRNLGGSTGAVTTLGPSSALTVDITANTAYAGSILGGGLDTGAVVKNGPAKWSLSGYNEYSGDTMLNAGILEVDGTVNGSEINVGGSATLSGYGIVSDVVVNSGGNLSPGHSPGVLTTRSVTTLAGSFSNIEIGGALPGNGATNHDQIISRGTVTAGGTLVVSLFGSFIPSNEQKFLVWTNDDTDPVSGFFSNFPTDLSLIPVTETANPDDYWQIWYNTPAAEMAGASGNDIRLMYFVPEPGSAALATAAAALALSRRRRRGV